MATFAERMIQRDYEACLRISDARRDQLKAARERAQNDPELCAMLAAEAARRGQPGIDWPSYFRNSFLV